MSLVDLTVIRGEGDIVGETISDTLISTVSVGVQRGRNTIDRNAKIVPVTLETRYRAGLRTGMVVEVMDALQSRVWRGKITSLDIAVEGIETTLRLRVEKA